MIQSVRGRNNGAHEPGRTPRGAELRLDAWDRYARILEAQLASLEGKEPDLSRFRELAERRAEVADEIQAMDRPLPETPETVAVLGRIRERLAECRATDRAVLDRLGQLRGDTERALRQMDARSRGRTGYLETAAAGGADAGGRRIDVRS